MIKTDDSTDRATVSALAPSGRLAVVFAWAQLVRLPNVLTIIADISAAHLLVAGTLVPLSRFVPVLLSGVFLYWAGMILNDVFDVEQDRLERSSRPLAAGRIAVSAARNAGGILLLLGMVSAGFCGWWSPEGLDLALGVPRFLPLFIAIVLAVMIVLYDGPLKRTALAPPLMGGCRFLSFLLGASPVVGIADFRVEADATVLSAFPDYVLAAAAGFGVFIMGVTWIGRQEAGGGRPATVMIGGISILIGGVLMAAAPQVGIAPRVWFVRAEDSFPILIGLILFPVVLRAARAVALPSPVTVQAAVKSGVMSIIPLAAAFAMLGAGRVAGLSVFALLVPSIYLATKFRVT